jgi:membrane-bound lytic murein transglycosylase D
MVCLSLAACATTAPIEDEGLPSESDVSDIPMPGSSAATVDEHLFVPEAEPQGTPHEHTGVWERLVHTFDLPECSDHEINLKWANWYADHPDYMARIFKRAEPWIFFISEELETRGLPGELALLPIVESAYDPFAYSSSRAMGTWQFIATTGRNYGLNQDWWYDGRRDVWSSTHAALDYLTYLHKMFDGDWLLALASYNSGEGRVSRQVRKNEANGKPADFWNLKLPRETRGYVPKLQGLACLFENHEEYGLELPNTANHAVVAAVDPGYQSDLVLISQIAEVPIDVIFTLNPGYNRWATSPNGPHLIVLPIAGADRLSEHLQNTDPTTLMKWDQVSVQSGDTLSHLAARHHVPVAVIRSSNGLQSDMIRVGQKLRLPRDDQLLIDPLYASSAQELQRLQAGLIASERVMHKVRSGESLSVIAQRYRVSVRDLQNWNNISDPSKLRAGKSIIVYHSPGAAPAAKGSGDVRHTVQRGDSLWSISRKYKVKMNDLMRWNDVDRNTVLQPGQSLRINL